MDMPAATKGMRELEDADRLLVDVIAGLEEAMLRAKLTVAVSHRTMPERRGISLHWNEITVKGHREWHFFIHDAEGNATPLTQVSSATRASLSLHALPALLSRFPMELEWKIEERKRALAVVEELIAAIEAQS
jgi:hypothetical protein